MAMGKMKNTEKQGFFFFFKSAASVSKALWSMESLKSAWCFLKLNNTDDGSIQHGYMYSMYMYSLRFIVTILDFLL